MILKLILFNEIKQSEVNGFDTTCSCFLLWFEGHGQSTGFSNASGENRASKFGGRVAKAGAPILVYDFFSLKVLLCCGCNQ